ncbi:hypothetical protein [Notoacmeibacter sp. MSK16QG-6]|uniref:hypothetical protein n=1 Tax=Notoacmeibacter sp. MSK16QG-6 TaxID=2957982 RepID=UPI00209E4AB4|nr:hypothetical protein [Notoacmeibacter sp. MSK16QG-6]MCP1199612.1 hypothetical protein [Notoacmeibacter sp. MSK16QG-6]
MIKLRSADPALFLVPAVMAMRLPLMFAELALPADKRSETTGAVTEKLIAAQVGAWAGFSAYLTRAAWLPYDLMSGRSVSTTFSDAQDRAANAALYPSMRQVKKNYRRLTRRSRS